MKKTSLFATDLDGTLLRNDGTVSSRDIKALQALRENGTAVVLATGRSPFSLKKCLDGRILPVDWFVLSSGAGVLNSSGDVMLASSLSASETLDIHSTFYDLGVMDTSIQGVFPDAHITHWMEGDHCLDFKKRLAYYRSSSVIVTSPQIPSTEVIGFVHPDKAETILEELHKKIGDRFSIVRATSPIDHNTVWIEVFAKGVNKASACNSIRETLEIPLAATAAVGNDWNDIQMLSWADRAFVTQNAPSALLHRFENVPSNQNHAVACAAELWRGDLS